MPRCYARSLPAGNVVHAGRGRASVMKSHRHRGCIVHRGKRLGERRRCRSAERGMSRRRAGLPQRMVTLSADGQLSREGDEPVLRPHVNVTRQCHLKPRGDDEPGAGFTGFKAGVAWEEP